MSLPNFVNFEPFNVLRRKMRAENLGAFEFDMPERHTQGEAAVAPKPAAKSAARPRKRAPAKRRVSDNE